LYSVTFEMTSKLQVLP